ncbi:solute carrier family 22 member 7-like [Uranotaenia lowii]|uniref:solute carrier family 22 member 7-like n=1 Tax=Uranotaenia lowii TaxID=190385 RepID=UPI002478BD9E|nr:solute carrier family 22 member 7-like [Uranotaenia lowii]
MSKQEEDGDAAFDRIMEMVGDAGPFQWRYNLIFNVVAVTFFAMNVVNILLILTVPEHHCAVPGMELYNVSDQELWNNLTLPRAPTSRGDLGYSSCTMYNVSLYPPGTDPAQLVFGENDTIPCQYGYWYDRQYYDKIPATQQNWVCEKELYATNVFAVIRMAEVLGSFALGQLGDRIGRLPVFLVSIVMIVVGRSLAVITDEIYWLFALLAFIGSFGTNTSFQSPLIVVMEISRDEDRAALSLWQLVGWTLGVSLPPLAFWWLRDWVWFMLLTSIPCALFILIPGYTIESPRWLATQGLYKKCLTELKKIAKVNARQFLLTEDELRERVPVKEVEKTYGIASLFSGWHMTKLSGLLLFSWICNTIPTYTLLLFSMQMGGNPFLNVFWQGAIELALRDSIGDTSRECSIQPTNFLVDYSPLIFSTEFDGGTVQIGCRRHKNIGHDVSCWRMIRQRSLKNVRRRPREIHSDIGTAFKGASNALHRLYDMLKKNSEDREQIFNWCATARIQWKFNPPQAPHFGGL